MKQFLVSTALAIVAIAPAWAASDLTVTMNQSKVVKLISAATTVVVGNPAIADVTMQDGTTAFVTGKSYGTTNIIAMDNNGRQIASFMVTVASETARTVTLMRGNQQISLSCAPRCEPVAGSPSPSTPSAAAPAN